MSLEEFTQFFVKFCKTTSLDYQDLAKSDEGYFDDRAIAAIFIELGNIVQKDRELAKKLMNAYFDQANKDFQNLTLMAYTTFNYPSGATYNLLNYNKGLIPNIGDEVQVTYVNDGLKEPVDMWGEVYAPERMLVDGIETRFRNENIKFIK